jgi:hypothetical protein
LLVLLDEEALNVSDTQPRFTSEYCMQFIGHKVVAYHVSGHVYRGRLHSVSDDGIYLMRAKLINEASGSMNQLSVDHAISNSVEEADISEAFFPFLFLPLVALTGLAAARPYAYPYGYYPGPWYY